MALHVPKPPGFAQMMKDGARHFSGLEEAVFSNIAACKEFSSTLKTAYGPQGRNKMVINHLEKLYVTNDAATIIRELEVEHPAAKLLVMASQMQEQEVGDGTNWVVIFGGALLSQAEEIIKMGITPTDVAQGYQMAVAKVLEELPKLVCWEVKDIRNTDEVIKALKTSIMSKQYGNEDFLAGLIAKACISILPNKKTSFNVDNIRVCKILGSGMQNSQVIQGMVFQRTVEGSVSVVDRAKVAVYSCPFDITTTETKGTVLINTAEELASFSRGEESKMEQDVKALADAGVTVVAAGGKIGDLALHYLNKYGIMGVRIPSKWETRRLCRAVGATILPKFGCPSPEEIGFCDKVFADEVGDTPVIVFKQEGESRIATIVIRGATHNYMDDIERAVDDAVNTYKAISKDGRFVAGAGSVEVELSRRVEEFSSQVAGLEQYAIKKYADALNVFPKILAQNCGAPTQETLSNLISAHASGDMNAGFDCLGEGGALMNAVQEEVLDAYITKLWAIKYATSATCQILCVDQIIMAKRAGGPKPRGMGAQDPDDDE